MRTAETQLFFFSPFFLPAQQRRGKAAKKGGTTADPRPSFLREASFPFSVIGRRVEKMERIRYRRGNSTLSLLSLHKQFPPLSFFLLVGSSSRRVMSEGEKDTASSPPGSLLPSLVLHRLSFPLLPSPRHPKRKRKEWKEVNRVAVAVSLHRVMLFPPAVRITGNENRQDRGLELTVLSFPS